MSIYWRCKQSEDVTFCKHFRTLDGYIYWYNVFLSVPLRVILLVVLKTQVVDILIISLPLI